MLEDVLPPRKLSIAAPMLASGLSFSPDARSLYFVALDLDPTYQATRLYRYDVDAGTLAVVNRDLRGAGGSLTPDGRRYVFARADGDHHDLAELDIATGSVRVIAREPHGAFIANPRVSPDGKRIVATRFDGQRFRVAVIDAHDGRLLSTLRTGDDPVHDASWVDDRRVVFLAGSASDAGFQVYDCDLDSGRIAKLTNAPFLAFQPNAADGRTLRFLNREGWRWTLDEIPLPPRAPPVVPPAAAAIVAEAPAPPAPETPQTPAEAPAAPPADAPEAPDAPPATPAAAAPTAALPPAPAAAEAPAPPPAAVATNVIPTDVSDTPASPIDHLFVPSLYGPSYTILGRAGELLGGVLSGGDRLERHRWALAGYYQFIGSGHAGGSFAYSNRQLAPLTLTLAAAQFAFADVPPIINGTLSESSYTLERRERQLTFDALRLFYENPVSLGFALSESFRPGDPAVLIPVRRIAGPHLSASFTGAATSPYTGASRLFFSSIDAAAYPRDWNSAGFGFFDLRGEIAATVPLPLYARHTLTFDAVGRGMVGAPTGERMLRVGGYVLEPIARRSDQPERTSTSYPFLPPGALFAESLRGFEDYPLAVDRIAIGTALYRLPVIIDRGWASTLWLLPSLFIRQINVDLFAVGASDGYAAGRHSAAGGSLTLFAAMWVVPISLRYQIARRFTDDQALVHLIQLGL